MAQLTQATGQAIAGTPLKASQILEEVAITDQTAASTAVSKYFTVPGWAKYMVFQVDITVIGGTSPTLDILLKGVNPWTLTTTHVDTLFTCTQVTAVTTYSALRVFVGPGVTGIADDTTLSGTASAVGTLNQILLPAYVFTYTTVDSADDADYTFSISAHFRG
jgi:hypothetical protein